MRNEILSPYYNKESKEVLYPPKRWSESKDKLIIDELTRSNKELEQFAFSASHDLQEPLKVISLYLQMLKRKYQGALDEKVAKDISAILDRSERMQKLIQSMLNYARIGKGNIQVAKINANVALNQAIDNLKVSIQENVAQIKCEDCPVVVGDEIQLTQLFQNLINNAIKFHKKDEHPQVYISVKQENNHWLFSVQDNGIGMDTKYTQNIFEIFKRLHSQHEYAGSGIGLSLCKKIVESHQGNIWAQSEIGIGTTIYFTIPKIVTTTL